MAFTRTRLANTSLAPPHTPSQLAPRGRAGGALRRNGEEMNETRLREHLGRLGLPVKGIEYVVKAALSGPERTVFHSNSSAFSGELPSSIATALTDTPSDYRIQFSAFSTEFAFLAVEAWNGDALLILDQPTSAPLTIINSRGKTQHILYTPDYLLVRGNAVEIVECKRADELRKLCVSKPGQWIEEEGGFTNPPARDYFKSIGMTFRVVTDIELPSLLVQNCILLRSSSKNFHALEDKELAPIAAFVLENGPCSIEQVVKRFDLENAAPVLQCVERRMVWADLKSVRLASGSSRFLCGTQVQALQIGAAIHGMDEVAISDEVVPFSEMCNPKHLAELAKRLAYVQGECPDETDRGPTDRTIRSWRRSFEKHGVRGLLPQWHRCGTRGPRIPEWHVDVVNSAIEGGRSGTNAPTCKSIYEGAYKTSLEEAATERKEISRPVSRAHFASLWRSRDNDARLARKRGGRRLANSLSPYTPMALRREKASFPFALAHIDHCTLPVKAIGTGEQSRRISNLTLTLLIDAFTDEPLAWHLSREPASSRATLLCLRRCARRYGRVPLLLLTDGGSDFKGTIVADALTGLEVGWMKRPAASGRAGQPVERPFNTVSMSACRGFPGYIQNILDRRSIDRKFDPENQPGRCVEDLRATLSDLLDHVLPNSPGTNGEASPREMRESFEAIYGRHGAMVDAASKKFLISTSVPIESDSTTTAQGAIRYDERRYVSRELTSRPFSTKKLHPRLDCEDDSIMYFGINGAWHSAHSSDRLRRSGIDADSLADTWSTSKTSDEQRDIAKAMAKRQAQRNEIDAASSAEKEHAKAAATREEGPKQAHEASSEASDSEAHFESYSALLEGPLW